MSDKKKKREEEILENDIIEKLKEVGWEEEVLYYPTTEDLIKNWQQIIYDNNKSKLNDVPISDFEMEQILDYVNLNCSTPVGANIFINGKNICIKRDLDSPDIENAGKEVYLDIFDPCEIAGGRTRYQIAQQPKFETDYYHNDRRGDFTLLINGIPVIHVELKASDKKLAEATNQLEKYAQEGVFTGIYGLVQVFFAMTPNDAVYFANPGHYTNYNSSFFFHWADEKNEPIKDWRRLCKGENALLSIPEAHQLVGYYTVADKDLDTLKVVRSYQYYAIRAILNRVRKQSWNISSQLGGYIWNTTGAGKTLTSFKAGQLIIDKGLADKVVFVVDRVELNNQSLEEYNSFAREGESVQETTSSRDLFSKLKSESYKDSMMVTSMQKLNKIDVDILTEKAVDLEKIRSKRIVFLIDEAHRSQFGSMHETVKRTFINSLFIGFTGTPIFSSNEKNGFNTESVFGPCLDSYSLADGIRDNNVLGFDPKAIKTYKDNDLRKEIALHKCNAKDESEIFSSNDSEKISMYKRYYGLPMTSFKNKDDKLEDGIEDLLPTKQYDNPKHREEVVNDIISNWNLLSKGPNGTKFHAILATTSIKEACDYYKLFKSKESGLRVTALFDSNIDNKGDFQLEKSELLIEIVKDYNQMFNQNFNRDTDPDYKKLKKDIVSRLSHKKQYNRMSLKGDENTLDILIVVNQLLTGFDSKYVNTLYLDKVLETDAMIQAISRTNRVLNNEEKPFGIFRFYRKPYTMQQNLKEALRLYCEGDTSCAIVSSLEENIRFINDRYKSICEIFEPESIKNFVCLPKNEKDREKFRKEFLQLKIKMNVIKLQGFHWDYSCEQCERKFDCLGMIECKRKLDFDKATYDILMMRYSDLSSSNHNRLRNGGFGFDLDTNLSEMDMEKIDADYLEEHFKKVVPIISSESSDDIKDSAIEEFEKFYPILSEKEQHYAKLILLDIREKVLTLDNISEKSLRELINIYIDEEVDNKITELCNLFDLDKDLFIQIYNSTFSEKDLNENNRFTKLLDSSNDEKLTSYFKMSKFKSRIELNKYLKEIILEKKF